MSTVLRLLRRIICNPTAEKVRLSSSLSGSGDFPVYKGHKAAQDLSKDTLKSHATTKENQGMNLASLNIFQEAVI